MKNVIRLLLIVGLIPTAIFSQTTYMVIHKQNGDSTVVNLDDIKNVQFEDIAQVTGLWNNVFYLGSNKFIVNSTLRQNGANLSGSLNFSDGSVAFGTDSQINGKSIKLTFQIDVYSCYFSGTVSDDYQSMSGSIYASNINMGSWNATKIGNATGKSSTEPLTIEKFKEAIKNIQ